MVRFHQHPGAASAIPALGWDSPLWLLGLVDQGTSVPEDAGWAISVCDRGGRILAWDGWYAGMGRTEVPETYAQLSTGQDWDEMDPRERWQLVLRRLNAGWVRYELSFHLSGHPTFGSVVESLLALWGSPE